MKDSPDVRVQVKYSHSGFFVNMKKNTNNLHDEFWYFLKNSLAIRTSWSKCSSIRSLSFFVDEFKIIFYFSLSLHVCVSVVKWRFQRFISVSGCTAQPEKICKNFLTIYWYLFHIHIPIHFTSILCPKSVRTVSALLWPNNHLATWLLQTSGNAYKASINN